MNTQTKLFITKIVAHSCNGHAVSVEEATRLLNNSKLSVEEVTQIRDDFRFLVEIIFDKWIEERKQNKVTKNEI